ncbi:secretin N-terminal domain-containing protein [Verrucomicrobium sp. BvORR106]|uniref:secretin N-terminal domain-containing protein n=1 Tax=Verrucomicrobium sp. BvORR106 TaxID=1403819 RepID=UPI00056E982D|nr:secretin N-terminal domain-containing protein [Verrucomicrobium sp. BvORR106]
MMLALTRHAAISLGITALMLVVPAGHAQPGPPTPTPAPIPIPSPVQNPGNPKKTADDQLKKLLDDSTSPAEFVEKLAGTYVQSVEPSSGPGRIDLLKWGDTAYHLRWLKSNRNASSSSQEQEAASFREWKRSVTTQNITLTIARLAAEFPLRYYFQKPDVPADKPPYYTQLHLASWSSTQELYLPMDDAGWQNLAEELSSRTNLKMERYADTRCRIEGHPLAMDEVSLAADRTRSERMFGFYPPPKSKGNESSPTSVINGKAITTSMGTSGPKATDPSLQLDPTGGVTPLTANEAAAIPTPAAQPAVPRNELKLGRMVLKVFQLRNASVEGQFLNASPKSATDLPTQVKIPGVATAFVEITGKIFGTNAPRRVSSGGTDTFEKALVLAGTAQRLGNNLGTDYYKPFPMAGQEESAAVLEDMLKASVADGRESASIFPTTGRSDHGTGNTDLPESSRIQVMPPVQKLLPEGVVRVDPRDFIQQEPTVAKFDTAGAEKRGYESASVPKGTAPPAVANLPTLRGTVIAERATNRLIVCDLAERIPIYEKIVQQLDVAPQLVEISVSIMDINANDTLEWGVDWAGLGKEEITEAVGTAASSFDGGLKFGGEGAANGLRLLTTPAGVLTADKVFHPVGLNVSTLITGTSGKLAARVQALESNGRAQVVSRPVLLTVANTEALFYDNNSLLLPVPGEFNADLFRINAPLALRIKPVVMHRDQESAVLLEIEIKDDNVTATANDGTVNASAKHSALLTESSIYTRALVYGGQSLLLGGRYRHEQRKQTGAVPLLSRIPLVGLAFKDRQNSDLKLQRLFLITPRLVGPEEVHPLGPELPAPVVPPPAPDPALFPTQPAAPRFK